MSLVRKTLARCPFCGHEPKYEYPWRDALCVNPKCWEYAKRYDVRSWEKHAEHAAWLRASLEHIQSMAGAPDAAHACRNIIARAQMALEVK